MITSEKGVLTNPPKVLKLKSLADIYAAEDARKAAASYSPLKFPEKSSCTTSNIKSEPLDFEEIYSSFGSEENDLNTSRWDAFDVSLKDLRARCKATKKRKADAKPKEADDLDEPLIVLKAKRSKCSYAVRSKIIVTEVIPECLNVQGSKGLAEEGIQGIQETLSVQTEFIATSSSNDVTGPGAGADGLIYNVNTETWGEIDMTYNSFYVDSEPLLEVEPIDIAPCKVDFVAKFDSSCDPSSNLIWPTNGNTQSSKNLMRTFNKPCPEIVGSEDNFYFPENGQSNLPESKILDAEVGANPFGSTRNASDSQSVTCSFNRAWIDGQSEESLYSLENSQGSLDEDKITEVESNVSPTSITGKLPTGENLICSFKEAFTNDVESGENLYSPESTHNSSVQSEIQDGPTAVAITENIQGGKDLISSCNEACVGDAESGGDLYSPEGSQNTLHRSKVTEAQSDVSPVTEISPDGENITSSCHEACTGDVESGGDLYSPEGSQNTLHRSKVTEAQSDVSPVTEISPDGENITSSCHEACTGDVESGGDLYSPEGSQNTLHGSQVTEARSDVSPVTEISPDEENITSSSNEACDNNSENEENVYFPENCRSNSEESEKAQVEASKNPFMVTDSATVDALANTHTENASSDNYGFPCESVPDFLDNTNLRSSEGQLESIVYGAISTSKCFYKKEDDTSTSVHSAPVSPTENSETDSNHRNGAVTNFDEVLKGSDQVQSTEETERVISGVLQLHDNLEKRQSTITDDEGAKLEKEVTGDPRTTREHAPIKLLSNRTIISPTSQEKLCQAITEIDLCKGAQISKCKKSIIFENCTRLKKCAITTQSTERVLQKTNGVIKKGNLKSTVAACTTDSSPKMDTEKAIEFSRRQMHDFENVTTKLLKNMRFMRSVLEESLAVPSPWLSKFSAEEIKTASENASELEKTTKRWLALMSKDCNRFCKILKSSGNSASSPPASNYGFQNRRKIVFADEAGGALCHIRVFDEASSPLKTAETENANQ